MKEDPALQSLRETAWRRPLTAAETTELRHRLANAPGATEDLQLEARLSRALAGLPDAPVPSNFTARVLQTLERAPAPPPRAPFGWLPLHGWLPRLGFACLVLGVSALGVHRYELVARQRMADSVAAISPLGVLPAPEALADFDAIRRLGSEPPADVELLSLLQ
jgi:anti-sigma factor RsiW